MTVWGFVRLEITYKGELEGTKKTKLVVYEDSRAKEKPKQYSFTDYNVKYANLISMKKIWPTCKRLIESSSFKTFLVDPAFN